MKKIHLFDRHDTCCDGFVSVMFVTVVMVIAVFAGCGKENSAKNTQEGNGYVEMTVEGVSVRVSTEGRMYGDVRLTDASSLLRKKSIF